MDPLEVEPLDEDRSSRARGRRRLEAPELEESSLEVALAVVAVSDWPEPVCVESVAAVLPSEPLAAIVPKAIAKVASAAATTRRRIDRDPARACAQAIADQVGVRGGGRRRGHAGKLGAGSVEQPGENLGGR